MPEEGLPRCDSWGPEHDWQTLTAQVDGHGSIGSYVIEECDSCGVVRLRSTDEIYVEQREGGYEQVDR